ncbi:hypothetical protein ACQPYA_18400 [Micromonospora sp. CA-263727]|uniref:hypothetical protein n=1 Tax=Micromonospora sp. CA-263727 TaxID=3239967 RepID=UPI003D8C1BF6
MKPRRSVRGLFGQGAAPFWTALAGICAVISLIAGGWGYFASRASDGARPGPTASGPPLDASATATTTTTATDVATTTPSAGPLLFTSIEPATAQLGRGLFGSDSWSTDSVSVETVTYDEAIVAVMIDCGSFDPRTVDYVLGRKYRRLTGRVMLADDSPLTKPLPMAIVLDEKKKWSRDITTSPLKLDVNLDGVNRLRFEIRTPGGLCWGEYSKLAFLNLVAR